MDAQTQAYIHYYNSQSGGQLPVFHGARRYQHGAGLGNFFASLARTIFPIAASGLGTFLSSMMQRKDEGADWRTSAKAALAPTAQTVMDKALTAVKNSAGSGDQGGGGKRRYRRKSKKRKSKENAILALQSGAGRRRRARSHSTHRNKRIRLDTHYISPTTHSRKRRRTQLKFLNF